MRRTLPLFLASVFLLAGCNSVQARYALTFKNTTPEGAAQLKDAVIRVVEARLESQKQKLRSHAFAEENGATFLTINASDGDAVEALTQQLTAPFTMRIMKEVPAGQGDLHSDKHGDFAETGITEEHFDFVQVNAESSEGKGAVTIHFTPAGKELLKQVFAQNRGEVVGIFVRDQLMSKKLIAVADTQDSVAIDNIPSTQIAAIFADDVNVGLHVTFAPAN